MAKLRITGRYHIIIDGAITSIHDEDYNDLGYLIDNIDPACKAVVISGENLRIGIEGTYQIKRIDGDTKTALVEATDRLYERNALAEVKTAVDGVKAGTDVLNQVYDAQGNTIQVKNIV